MNLKPFSRTRHGTDTIFPPIVPTLDLAAQIQDARQHLKSGHTELASVIADTLAVTAPLNSQVLHLRGDCLMHDGKLTEAIALFDKALPSQDDDDLWASKGRALAALGRNARAALCFERAHALAPHAEHWHALAENQLIAGAPQDAYFAMAEHSETSDLLKSRILTQLGRKKEAMAVAHAQKAITAQAFDWLCDVTQTTDDMVNLQKRAVDLLAAKDTPIALVRAATQLVGEHCPQKTQDRLSACIEGTSSSSSEKANAHLALFRISDQRKDTAHAAEHLSAYNKCAQATSNYTRSKDSVLFTMLMRLRFTPLPSTKSSILPLFVTGLPGSGVAAMARILEQGSLNRAARQLTFVETIMTRFIRHLRQEKRLDVTREDLLVLQSQLREGLRQAADGADVLIDCTRLNFRWSGLLAAALPEARVVHMTRDHVHTAWTMFRSDGPDLALGCRHTPMHLAAYLLRSANLMRHWESRHANICGVSGDALCRPGGHTAHAVLKRCGLNWSAHCDLPKDTANRDWHRYATTAAPLRLALREFTDLQPMQLPM